MLVIHSVDPNLRVEGADAEFGVKVTPDFGRDGRGGGFIPLLDLPFVRGTEHNDAVDGRGEAELHRQVPDVYALAFDTISTWRAP